ncbi:MAG: histidine phosphotransferase [Caulobacterales bacterium 32-69-10]|nr:MAG: histidine phosphotransferase [Caulobacterales bacterium 32-69-10]
MTDAVSASSTPTSASAPAESAAQIAAFLAARMCHDFISPVSAIVSGLDLLEDPDAQDMREDAMGLIAASGRKLADWAVEAQSLDKASARAVLNIAQMAGAALPLGGRARLKAARDGAATVIVAEASGAKARLRPEVAAGLRGEPLPDGALHGHWVQAYYVHLFVVEAGGKIFVEAGEEKVTFAATLPGL